MVEFKTIAYPPPISSQYYESRTTFSLRDVASFVEGGVFNGDYEEVSTTFVQMKDGRVYNVVLPYDEFKELYEKVLGVTIIITT